MIQQRHIFNTVRDAIFIADVESGMIVDANHAAEALCGRSLEELRSMQHVQLHPTERADEARRGFEKDACVADVTEGTVLDKIGRPIPVEIVSSQFTDPNGRGMLVLVLRDIADRKRAEEAVPEDEQLYRTLFDQSRDCIFLLRLDGSVPVIAAANPAALKAHGYSRAELLGQRLSLIEPEFSNESFNTRIRAAAYGKPVYCVHRRKDGSTFKMESVASLVKTGARTFALEVARNVSELKEGNRVLRRQNEFIQAVLDNISDGVVACDSTGNLALFNRAAREWHGIDALRLPPDQWSSHYDLVDSDGTTPLATDSIPLMRAFHGEHVRNVPLTIAAKGQHVRHVLASGCPFYDEQRHMLGAVVALHDITESKRAEAVLRESEQRFRTVADCAPVMIWMSGQDKLCTFFNKPWLDFTGRTLEEEAGNGWAEGVHPEDLDRCFTIYSSSFDMRRNFQMQYRLRRADGEYRWVLDTGTPLYREGEFAGYIGSCIDVTEYKGVEEHLRRNHDQLVNSQRLAHVGSWELDLATHRTWWSDEWYRIFGLPRDVRKDFETFLSCVHPKDRWMIPEAQQKAISIDAPFAVEFRMMRPGGEVRSIRSIVQAVKNDDGTVVRLDGAAQDITEQVKATELLRESEARLKTAERMTHVGHWTWHLKTNQTSWSEEARRIMGQPPDHEFGYETFLEMVLTEDREPLQAWVDDCRRGERGGVIEYRVIRPDGSVRTVVSTCEVLLDEDGSPERLFGTCQDVTEDRCAQAESFARQKLESLGTLASGIAHDFNNLLGAILAQSDVALAELATGSRPDHAMKSIHDVAIRGSEIVRQLMVYAGQENDMVEPVDVSKVIAGMLGLLKLTVSRRATLVTDLGDDLPAVHARAAQLNQIVMNLVVNASEAMGDHDGVIRVATQRTTVGSAEAAAKTLSAGDYIRLEVTDSGRGMSPETQAKVFDPFFTTKFLGRGLGLAVVQGIVRGLRGTIEVASEPGKGTTFRVLLPCAESVAKPDADAVVEEPARPAKKAVVLLVEDEEQLRLGVATMLRRSGLEVLEADSGTAAIDHLRSTGEIDLILLDLTIPGNSSQEVVAEAALSRPDVKVILTSAYSEQRAMSTISTPLVRGFIRKPFRLVDLVQKLRGALSS